MRRSVANQRQSHQWVKHNQQHQCAAVNSLNALRSLAIAFVIVLTACGTTPAAPKPTVKPTAAKPTRTPTVWDVLRETAPTIKTLCLQVQQSYPELQSDYQQPIADTITSLLHKLGIDVVNADASCEATLNITLECKALGAKYSGAKVPLCYTGASCNGEAVLTWKGQEPYRWQVIARNPPVSGIIMHCPEVKSEAPIRTAWIQAVLLGLERAWGQRWLLYAYSQAVTFNDDDTISISKAASEIQEKLKSGGTQIIAECIIALKVNDHKVRWAAANVLAMYKADSAPAVPALRAALNDSNITIKYEVVDTLRRIGPAAIDAVPDLMAMLEVKDKALKSRVIGALASITGKDFGTEIATPTPTAIPTIEVSQPTLLATISESAKTPFYIAFTPDSAQLVIAHRNNLISVWSADGSARIRTFDIGVKTPRDAMALSPDGKTLAIGHDDGIRFWELVTGQQVRSTIPARMARCLAYSTDGRTLAVGNTGNNIELYDTASLKQVKQLAGVHNCAGIAFSPDGKLLAAGTANLIRVYDISTGEVLRRLSSAVPRDSQGVNDPVFSPNGAKLAAAGGNAHLWNTATGELLYRLPVNNWAYDVAFSPDGRVLASAASAYSVDLFDVNAGQLLLTIKDFGKKSPTRVVYSPDGTKLAASLNDGRVLVWRVGAVSQ